MTADQGKICVACGESCLGQPRVRDKHGHYYHEKCHGKAQRQQWRRQEEQANAPSASFANSDTFAAEDAAVVEIVLNEAAASSASATAAEAPDFELRESNVSISPRSPVAVLSPLTCPKCDAAVQSGAVVCLNCGYSEHPVTTLIAKSHEILTAPFKLGIGWLISPKAVGLATLFFFVSLIVLAFFSQTGQRIFIGSYIALVVGATIWAVLVGFKYGSSHGLLTLFVPFYIFYTVYALNENDYLKWVYSIHLMCIPACLVFYLDRIGVLTDIGVAI